MKTQEVLALDGSTDSTESVLRGDSEFGVHPERAEEATLHQKAAQRHRRVLVNSTGIHGMRVRHDVLESQIDPTIGNWTNQIGEVDDESVG